MPRGCSCLETTSANVTVFQVSRPNGETSPRPVQSMEDSLTFLRVNLAAEGVARPAALALFRLFRNGLVPNVVFDKEATQRREMETMQQVRPVMVRWDRSLPDADRPPRTVLTSLVTQPTSAPPCPAPR